MSSTFFFDDAKIIKNYSVRLLGLFRWLGFDREHAKDLAQETLKKAYIYKDSYDNSKCLNTWNWLSKIAINIASTIWKKTNNEQSFLENFVFTLYDSLKYDSSKTPEEIVIIQEIEHLLKECLNELSNQEKNITIDRYWWDLSYKEIGKKYNRPPGTVKVIMQRIRETLHNCLGGKGYDEM